MIFYPGLHQPSDAQHFGRSFISVNRLRNRVSDFAVHDWIMDSGAFSEIFLHGGYRHDVQEYAGQIARWSCCGNLVRAVAQDWMCEPDMLQRTGLSIKEHQRLTVERYDQLLEAMTCDVEIMPVLQGFAPEDYVRCIELYGDRLTHGMWVGVGSVCKRNGTPGQIEAVLDAIHNVRPDLRLHGFGVKLTSLASGLIRARLYSADSMAWSYAARREGRNANDWREAASYAATIERMSYQTWMFT
jgi:hypothetical protein